MILLHRTNPAMFGFVPLLELIRFTHYSNLFGSWGKTDRNNWFPLSGDVWQSAPSTFVRTSITAALTPAKWMMTLHLFHLISWFLVDIRPDKTTGGNVKQCQFIFSGAWAVPGNIIIISTQQAKPKNTNRTAGLGAAVPVRTLAGRMLTCSDFVGSKSTCGSYISFNLKPLSPFYEVLLLPQLRSPAFSSNLTQVLHCLFIKMLLVLHRCKAFWLPPVAGDISTKYIIHKQKRKALY